MIGQGKSVNFFPEYSGHHKKEIDLKIFHNENDYFICLSMSIVIKFF